MTTTTTEADTRTAALIASIKRHTAPEDQEIVAMSLKSLEARAAGIPSLTIEEVKLLCGDS